MINRVHIYLTLWKLEEHCASIPSLATHWICHNKASLFWESRTCEVGSTPEYDFELTCECDCVPGSRGSSPTGGG
jgi:hypothetical protein